MIFTLNIVYLIATITFIVGLKMLGHPETAKKGNLTAAIGMGLAIVGTIVLHQMEIPSFIYILIGIAIVLGAIIGWIIAIKVEMTKMPELVSLFNGFGGASAALIGLVEYNKIVGDMMQSTITIAAIIIGSITFSGSLIAWAKLNGTMRSVLRLPKYGIINNMLFLGLLIFGTFIVMSPALSPFVIYILPPAATSSAPTATTHVWPGANTRHGSNWRKWLIF